MKRPLLKILLIVLILGLLTAQVRYRSLSIDIFVSFIVFFIVTAFFVIRYPLQSRRILLYFIGSTIFLGIIVTWLLEGFPLLGLPNTLMMLLGSLLGHSFVRSRKTVARISIILLSLGICSVLYVNHDKWLHYINFGNFSGQINEQEKTEWSAYNKQGDTITSSSFKNKIVLLDFWNKGCGVCFRKFPHLQDLYERYKNDPDVLMQAVYIPWEDDESRSAFQIIEQKGYTFPVLAAAHGMDSVFKIQTYPTVIVLDDGKPIFRGDIEEAAELLERLDH